ncbi:von Willebrand factor type A [Vibrio phage 1.188.A._10N.286.51.A6]|uniref:von Willebrand factor type A n=3 Tax=Mukerjeevirus mv51A6 TaxID=2734162 RepID=A0A2I7RJ05_9CAUD|nr:HNH endonuclease [Vibrio phage 1.188.A._10N.286.51.A6]AUR93631.1 von Willebrand factor type A [Vibrio phage 1.188.A._10N.286.51.A6]AUR93717.1 von Willebrand factor type A [Vibrio phage 1.188.B._10N.286.51.A6]AUR93803.1 von Willebrand factor type A [Vibrio phage 1.188.C._10N.286.51.A6]
MDASKQTPQDLGKIHLQMLLSKYFRSIQRGWLARLLVRIPIEFSDREPYGMTNGKEIFINSTNIQQFDEDFQFGLITHELWHIVLKHCMKDTVLKELREIDWRDLARHYYLSQSHPLSADFTAEVVKQMDAGTWVKYALSRPVFQRIHNIIADAIINNIIERKEHPKGFGALPIGKPPESPIVSELRREIHASGTHNASWKSLGRYLCMNHLETLLQEEQQHKGNDTSLGDVMPDNFRITEEELEKIGELIPPQIENPDHDPDDMGSSQGDRKKGKATAVATSQYWSSALQRFLVSRMVKGAGKTTVNRRKLPRDIYKRQHHIEQKVLNLTIMADVSGSIDQWMIDKFYGNIRRIASEIQPENLTLVTWDTRIIDEVKYHKTPSLPKHFPLKAHGGGTRIQCVGYWLQEHVAKKVMPNEQEIVIIFTDMAFNLPEIETTFPKGIEVIWAAFDIYNKASAVKTIEDLNQHTMFQLKEK